MAQCPEIEIYDDDPFIYYARALIDAFKQRYGTELSSHTNKNVFEEGLEINIDTDSGTPFDDPLPETYYIDTKEAGGFSDWSGALPYYIKGPKYTIFSDYSIKEWSVDATRTTTDEEDDWISMAGCLVVHPMLRVDYERYVEKGRSDTYWENWFSTEEELREDVFKEGPGSLGSTSDDPMTDALQFAFLLEVLDSFLHINEDKKTSDEHWLKTSMQKFTWCQMFWYGYETHDVETTTVPGIGEFADRTQLGKQAGSPSAPNVGSGAGLPVWAGELDPEPQGSHTTSIRYYPKKGARKTVSSVDDGVTNIDGRGWGAIHSNWCPDRDEHFLGHSVRIVDADYRAFVTWLEKAITILDDAGIGPGSSWYDGILEDAGYGNLTQTECSLPPYGGSMDYDALSDSWTNSCSMKVFRSMVDKIYFSGSASLDEILHPDSLDFWYSFLEGHNASPALSTEILNQAIMNSGVIGVECDSIGSAIDIGLDFQPINASDCKDIVGPPIVETYMTCIPNPQALTPNWLNQTEEEPFLNQKTCEYSIVMLADPPDCSQAYLDSFIPSAMDKLLSYYNKEKTTTFLDLSDGTGVNLNSKDSLIDGSSGFYLDGIVFSGTARVKDFYIPPRPLAKTKVLITVSAEEFNRILDKTPSVEEQPLSSVHYDGESSFVVFLVSEMQSIFDKVSYGLELYENSYAHWHLETGRTIKGLNLTAESSRIMNFYKELMLLFRESGYPKDDLEWVEIGFSPTYKIEYIKVQKPFSPPFSLEKGVDSFINRPVAADATAMAYISQLPNIKTDMMARNSMTWYDMVKKYRYPEIEESYGLNLTSPVVEGNEGIKKLSEVACPGGTSAGVFEGKATAGEWAMSQVNDIKSALLSQLSANPCVLVDHKILEHQGREDFAMQITDMTLKEYLTSDRFINDLPELLVRGRYDDINALYGGMLNNLGMCGLFDLIKAAVDCALNALGYDDSVSIIAAAAIRGMDDEFIGNFISSMSPEMQEVVVATIREAMPQLLPFLSSFVTVTIVDNDGATIEPVYDRRASYTSTDVPFGSLGDQSFRGITQSPGAVTAEVSLSNPPGSIGSIGGDNRYPTPQDYGELKNVVADLVMNDLLNADDLLDILNTLPGAGIAMSILEKIDKFCAVPPLFYPPLKEFIKIPGVNIDVCELQVGITVPIMPKIRFNSLGKILIDNAWRVLKELLIRLLILILKKILEIIAEELCKTRVGADPLNLREAMLNGICGDLNVDSAVMDDALGNIMGSIGSCSDPVALGRYIDNVASVVTQCELLDLITGEGSDNLYDLVIEITKNDPVTEPLSECLYDKPSVHQFFKSIGVFVDLEALCIDDATNLPVSKEVCDNLGLLNVFRSVRADALREKGVDEECIEDQLCKLRERTVSDLEDLMGLLQAGIFDSVIPNIFHDVNDPDKPSLLPAALPDESIAMDTMFNSMFDAMAVSFTEDIIGRRGFLNMVLADSRGRGYNQHLKFEQMFGPSFFNLYGSYGTRAHPPRDEWGKGAEGNKVQDHNGWVTGPLNFTDDAANFFWLPFLFNPLSADGTQPEAEGDPDNDQNGDGAPETHGRPPAIGGLPDKVAGHLQYTLENFSVSYSLAPADPYSVVIPWIGYEEENPLTFMFSYDYWTPPPEGQEYTWDGHRMKVVMTSEDWEGTGDSFTETLAYMDVNSSVSPGVADFKETVLDLDLKFTSPDYSWLELLKYKVDLAFGGEISPSARGSTFKPINRNLINQLAAKLASNDRIFNYGFRDADGEVEPPKVVYFHQTAEFDDIAAAIERYGGSEGNPPFYIRYPDPQGFLKIAQDIIPSFKPCETPDGSTNFPKFKELAKVADAFAGKIKDDPRGWRKVDGVTTEVESPFDRILPKAALGVVEGTIAATIRVYAVEFMLKALPALSVLGMEKGNYGDVFADYIIENMEKGLLTSGRGKRYNKKYEDYWWLFLEQVVQNFGLKVQQGIILDETPEEKEARDLINQHVKNNWTYTPPEVFTGLFSAKKTSTDRKEKWDAVFQGAVASPTAGLPVYIPSPVIGYCKTILRRYVLEEFERTSEIFQEVVKSDYTDIDDFILKNRSLIGGAIDTSTNGGDGGPLDVPSASYYASLAAGASADHPLERLEDPDPGGRGLPFILERYVVIGGTLTDASANARQLGYVANLADLENILSGHSIVADDGWRFGLRLTFIPEMLGASVASDFEFPAASDLTADFGYMNKAYHSYYKNAIPLAEAELEINEGELYTAQLYNDYLQNLICKLIETPEYKMLFEHCFPMPKYMALLAIYCGTTFVPSLANVEDGWAAKNDGSGGGRWIGLGKFGGMNTWRGNEGMVNSFQNTKRTARQILEATCYTNYDYVDRDGMTPEEVYIENDSPTRNSGVDLKWWQWSSLRPSPCKEE